MPPSAGACQTMDAEVKPDCGRAGERSSTITAIGCRAAAAGETSRPVSGAGTRTGVGAGVGVGETLGDGSRDGDSGPDDGWVGSGDGGALPRPATRPELAGEADGPAETAA